MASRSLSPALGAGARTAALSIAAWLAACASGGPTRPQDAGRHDAQPDLDGGVPIGEDGGSPPPIDAWVMPGEDGATPPPVDAWTPPPIDGGTPTGTGRYLDRCTATGDCASGPCVDDVGATRFCSRSCTSDAQCAHEHVCVAGTCVPDDTGTPCSVASPASCATGLCLGSAAGGQCTRYCSSAAECPSGYACTTAGGSTMPICVDIERPCSAAADCGSGLCIPGIGCTAACRSAADCPGRLTSIGLPPYTCRVALGSTSPICVPPDDVMGPDPIGASCAAAGANTCRSGACDGSAPLGPMCTQACTAQGGCAPGLGCYPLAEGSTFILTCQRAGLRDLGQSCASARECHSALCDSAGYCTRLCADGLCPTGWTCMPVPGAGVAICRRP